MSWELGAYGMDRTWIGERGDQMNKGREPGTPLNPKDLMGRSKVMTLSVIPSTALIHMGEALRYGAFEAPLKAGGKGYGRFNWRDSKIAAMLYIDAAMRHALDWVDGEECAPDSKVKHLGHAMATIGIILDAQECGTLVDDRPTKGNASKLLESLTREKVEPTSRSCGHGDKP